MKKRMNIIVVLVMCIFLAGCATAPKKAFEASESQVKLRSMQTRAFDTTDSKKMMQTVISTMQDLNFVIDKADLTLGSVTGTKFFNNASIVMTVTVRPRGDKQLLVRANAQVGVNSIDDPATYQDFFAALEKAMFLTAQQVD
jgi:ABC-type glycerol-3-phosphate transport system substrate-binding protein